MIITVDNDLLQARAAWLRTAIDAIPSCPLANSTIAEWNTTIAETRAAFDKLTLDLLALPDHPAGIRHANNTTTIAMMGIKVSCTAGLRGACDAWIRRAQAVVHV